MPYADYTLAERDPGGDVADLFAAHFSSVTPTELFWTSRREVLRAELADQLFGVLARLEAQSIDLLTAKHAARARVGLLALLAA